MRAGRAAGLPAIALCGALLLAACGGGGGTAQTSKSKPKPGALVGLIGPGFSIELENAQGKPVSRVAAGRYRITVHDRSKVLDFHFSGPGVEKRTSVVGTGTAHWLVTLEPGVYRYRCDAHETLLNGSLRVGK